MGMIGLGRSVKSCTFQKWVLMGPMEHECSIGPSIRNSLILQKFIAQNKVQQRFIYCSTT